MAQNNDSHWWKWIGGWYIGYNWGFWFIDFKLFFKKLSDLNSCINVARIFVKLITTFAINVLKKTIGRTNA